MAEIRLTRDEALSKYVKMIMENGNPEYFVWNAVSGWASWEVQDALDELDENNGYVVEDDE